MSDPAVRYAVFGQPVAHSLSPRIHAAFAAQRGVAIDYCAIESGQDSFAARLQAFAESGGRGANVTLPLKQHALGLCVELSARAARCGSVNTLIRHGDNWHGDSSDGIGLLRDLEQRHRIPLAGRRCLLLGAGGAARAAAFALLDAGVDALVIVNRSPARAETLAAALADPARVQSAGWDALDALGGFDLIVNATAAGHAQTDLALPISLATDASVAYDLSYGAAAHAFISWAQQAGAAQARDGLGMLVEQAAESFAHWFGWHPVTTDIHAELRAQLDVMRQE